MNAKEMTQASFPDGKLLLRVEIACGNPKLLEDSI